MHVSAPRWKVGQILYKTFGENETLRVRTSWVVFAKGLGKPPVGLGAGELDSESECLRCTTTPFLGTILRSKLNPAHSPSGAFAQRQSDLESNRPPGRLTRQPTRRSTRT